MKAIARLVEPSSLISVHSLDVAPVSHSLNRLICQGFVGSRVDRKHLASEDGILEYMIVLESYRLYFFKNQEDQLSFCGDFLKIDKIM